MKDQQVDIKNSLKKLNFFSRTPLDFFFFFDNRTPLDLNVKIGRLLYYPTELSFSLYSLDPNSTIYALT